MKAYLSWKPSASNAVVSAKAATWTSTAPPCDQRIPQRQTGPITLETPAMAEKEHVKVAEIRRKKEEEKEAKKKARKAAYKAKGKP